MIKIKLFSIKKSRDIEGEKAELYCNLYLVLNRTYVFTFLIESPDLTCTDRHLVRLIKTWIIQVEEDSVKWMRRFESKTRGRRMTREEIKEKAIEKADEILMILGRGPGKNKVLDYHEKNEAAYHDLVEIARSVGMEITNETAISTMFCVEVMRRLINAKWIPVSKRVPEESLNSVIGWDRYRERCVFVQYIDGHFQNRGNTESFDIVAWMPLPKPYKEGVEEHDNR